jgi:hypothetical protein
LKSTVPRVVRFRRSEPSKTTGTNIGLLPFEMVTTRSACFRYIPGMPSTEQCRNHAAQYKMLAKEPNISARRSAVLSNISRSWTALANQLEGLAVIIKDEGK